MTRELQCSVLFFPHFCIFQDLCTGKVRGIGKEEGDIYLLLPKASERIVDGRNKVSSCVAERLSEDVQIWHKRLGHVPAAVMKKLDFIKNKVSICSFNDCTVCPLVRQTRKPFPVSSSRSAAVFDLLHIDIWGPYRVPTLSGHRYFLTVVDDHSKMIWIFDEIEK